MSYPDEDLNILGAVVGSAKSVLELVNALIGHVPYKRDIELFWREGRCHIGYLEVDATHYVVVPMPKSVVRAVLARIAVLCAESSSNSVSPYGGRGEIQLDGRDSKSRRAEFINTPERQSLILGAVRPTATANRSGASRKEWDRRPFLRPSENASTRPN